MPQFSGGPFRKRTWLRQFLPWFLIDLGLADKGEDCENKMEPMNGTTLIMKKAAVITVK